MRHAVLLAVLVASCGGSATPLPHSTSSGEAVWTPTPGTTWQWQLSGEIDRSFDVAMYDVDLFDTPVAAIEALAADGRTVVCYFSAGSHESWRVDADAFPVETIGMPLDGWPGERWLDVRRLDLLAPILEARLDLARDKGCDGVEPDNVDGYSNESGFLLEGADQLAFNRWLAAAAHERGLSVGLKNDLDQVPALVDEFDWLLVEQCVEFDECELTDPFVAAGKAVFVAEYSVDADVACAEAAQWELSLILKDVDLSARVAFCG
jgi:hypothetical protein